MTSDDLMTVKPARSVRESEALREKDEQIRRLTEEVQTLRAWVRDLEDKLEAERSV